MGEPITVYRQACDDAAELIAELEEQLRAEVRRAEIAEAKAQSYQADAQRAREDLGAERAMRQRDCEVLCQRLDQLEAENRELINRLARAGLALNAAHAAGVASC